MYIALGGGKEEVTCAGGGRVWSQSPRTLAAPTPAAAASAAVAPAAAVAAAAEVAEARRIAAHAAGPDHPADERL